jgi:hypothetical protein
VRRENAWLLFATGDAALCVGLAALTGWALLYALAPLSFPMWAWLDGRPEGRAIIDRFFGR